MASVAMLVRGALGNELAFTGSSYLFHRLSADNIDAERKRLTSMRQMVLEIFQFKVRNLGKMDIAIL